MKECDQNLKGMNISECESITNLENKLISEMIDRINQTREGLIIEGLRLKGYDFKAQSKEFYDFVKENISRQGNFEDETYYLKGVPFLEMSTDTVIDNPLKYERVFHRQLTTHKFL